MAASLPGARVEHAARSARRPARLSAPAAARASASFASSARRGRRLDAVVDRLAELARQLAVELARVAAASRAVISAASSAGMMPSLSVVHTVPSRRRNDAPALSSPPKPSEPSSRPSTNHLKPTGTSYEPAAEPRGDAVDHAAADQRLADGRVRAPLRPMAEQVVDRRPRDSGSAAAGRRCAVTMPWRSWSVSQAKAMSKRSFRPISRCIA